MATLEEMFGPALAGRAVIVGVLNVTPDSFSDGGRFIEPRSAVEQARRMVADGADAIDIGAESTRPGSARIPPTEQIARLRGVLEGLVAFSRPISVDTTSAAVARFALDCGAAIINDVSAGREDPAMLPLVASSGAGLVLMHMLGEPATMQRRPRYENVVREVRDFLAERLAAAEKAGVERGRCIVDPGIGFGKTLQHNLALLAGVGELAGLGCPVMVGPSRKRFIGELTGQDQPDRRASGTVATCLAARRRGAGIFRVHDVRELADALKVEKAVEEATGNREQATG